MPKSSNDSFSLSAISQDVSLLNNTMTPNKGEVLQKWRINMWSLLKYSHGVHMSCPYKKYTWVSSRHAPELTKLYLDFFSETMNKKSNKLIFLAHGHMRLVTKRTDRKTKSAGQTVLTRGTQVYTQTHTLHNVAITNGVSHQSDSYRLLKLTNHNSFYKS